MMISFNNLGQINIKRIYGPQKQEVGKLSFHSKRVEADSAYFSIRGVNFNGDDYIEEAILSGANTVFSSDRDLIEKLSTVYPHCTFLLVGNVRESMAAFAKLYFDKPDEKLKTIGVTGTNGKTTVTAYVRSLLSLLGMPTGSIGTTGIWSSERKLDYKKSTPTTPEALDLHQIFSDLVNLDDEAVTMEVSSIALDQHRVDGILFDVGIHTNFSEEHLEYHKTIDHYKECKLRLFQQSDKKVVNLDDAGMGADLIANCKGSMLTYSIESHPEADLRAENIEVMEEGSIFDLWYKGSAYPIYVPVYGTYNVANVLSAVGAALHLGFSMQDILCVLPSLQGPVGRFQVMKLPQNQKVILDYAHTPVALNRLVEEVKKLKYRRLIVMIAGIGIRDFNKMPKMAAEIEGKADEVVVTVDHPGYNDPKVIVEQVMTGFKNPDKGNIHTTLTRKEGVERALNIGGPDDIILLTSGCINNAQNIRGEEVPHSDEAIIERFYPPVAQ
ncbi:UDP-N-acetylmuramoyl-L-alanyl-D-glutamate--2,6-diaminopimelate ligase [Halobacillus yeomjeoni]|uniref:UDP-N-acetylmuramoyl-L-alanyl-D-glutamate--2, 6-diaminopimelate ligase n=1 Tax=Halobacillus yeomjeoni TaxID=311194 RepID=A0A931MWM2_9BACI|nr:UDP-N-acetylmuramoyl-L-alanyl-D-glutamate--2,6-diaminopimelate ligase [Halobacillus yeomjeoni]MBH0231702.1 UDP-N-acetylmuramoyl-L-alanyl-D-glutamate--2,6-diaminopimelate ligase [Halobacillus yeomjeoni]